MNRFFRFIALASILLPTVMFAKKKEVVINVVPYPQSIEIGKGQFKAAGASFNCDQAIDQKSQTAIKEFADKLTYITGRTSSFATPPSMQAAAAEGAMKGFVFLKDSSLGAEEYSITVLPKSCMVKASSFNGFLYAITTIKQLTDAEIYSSNTDAEAKFFIPCVTIKDKPRFAYRGMHLDCSRHFFSVEEVKKYLDIMAEHKLNTLHWHITDDQGWRAEIKKYPRLTEVGAFRDGTVIKKDWGSNDGIRYGGYYTQEQMKDVIAYAASRGIKIIPEVDLPGHMQAVLASYPQFGCKDSQPQPYKVWTRWGVSKQVLCVGKEETMKFLEDVVSELADIFPGEYFHIGGDECPRDEWATDPDCQAKIKELGLVSDENASAESRLQNYVVARIQKALAAKGKKVIGWDEILEGELAPGATVMSWRGTKGGIKASSMGYDVIMTPNTYLYFDYLQGPEDSEPFGIGGNLPMDKVYAYEPFEGLDAAQQKHILGVQANLWTEYISTPEHLEYMLLPRMAALSEIQWCKPEDKDYDRFMNSLHNETYKIYDTLGYNYKEY